MDTAITAAMVDNELEYIGGYYVPEEGTVYVHLGSIYLWAEEKMIQEIIDTITHEVLHHIFDRYGASQSNQEWLIKECLGLSFKIGGSDFGSGRGLGAAGASSSAIMNLLD